MKISTAQEAINGNSNDTVITPLRLKQVLNSINMGGGGSGGVTKETDPVFKSSPAGSITSSDMANWNAKQEKLVSGNNIKTINGQDILGEGDIVIESGSDDIIEVSVGQSEPTNGEKVWFQTIGNLFNKETVTVGRYLNADGSYSRHSQWYVSDYIEVEPNEQYTYSGYTFVPNNSDGGVYNAYYDANKNLVSTFLRNAKKGTITIPSNVRYVCFSIYMYSSNDELNDLDNFQFEKGSVATDYKPYSNKQSINILNNGSYEEFLNVDNLLTKDDNLIVEETDPTVPQFVKEITQEDIDRWNSGGGSKDSVPINAIFEYEGDDIPDGYAEIIGESEDGTMGGLVDTYDLLQFVYPVGSIFISNTNVDPATFMGGEWELIDKHYKEWSFYSTDIEEVKTYVEPNTANATMTAFGIVRSEHSVYVRYYFKPKASISDSKISIGTMKFDKFGIKNELYLGIYDLPIGSENGIVLMNIAAGSGEMYTSDVVVKGSSTSVGTSETIRFEFEVRTPKEYMLDDHCDKFFWKRLL